eukprot:457751-Prymnesium_polylepis.1
MEGAQLACALAADAAEHERPSVQRDQPRKGAPAVRKPRGGEVEGQRQRDDVARAPRPPHAQVGARPHEAAGERHAVELRRGRSGPRRDAKQDRRLGAVLAVTRLDCEIHRGGRPRRDGARVGRVEPQPQAGALPARLRGHQLQHVQLWHSGGWAARLSTIARSVAPPPARDCGVRRRGARTRGGGGGATLRGVTRCCTVRRRLHEHELRNASKGLDAGAHAAPPVSVRRRPARVPPRLRGGL